MIDTANKVCICAKGKVSHFIIHFAMELLGD